MMTKTIINSTLGLSTAFLFTILIHEVAHYCMSILLGYEATLFHNRVYTKSIENSYHEMLIAGIGPVISLLQGIVAFQVSIKMAKSSLSLFLLWTGMAGIITFFGYLMIAPLIPIGDTGKVFSILALPMGIQVAIAIVAVALITIILVRSTSEFEKYALEDFGSNPLNRKKWSISLILIPLILSIVIITILQFPIPHIASILATICAPFSIMAVFGTFIGRRTEIGREMKGISVNGDVSTTLVGLFVFVVLANRLLVQGL